jgi:hypothetical protein
MQLEGNNVWHANGNGSKAAMSGQISPTGFTGHLQRDNWLCIYDVTMQPVPGGAQSAALPPAPLR